MERDNDGEEQTYKFVGADQIDPSNRAQQILESLSQQRYMVLIDQAAKTNVSSSVKNRPLHTHQYMA